MAKKNDKVDEVNEDGENSKTVVKKEKGNATKKTKTKKNDEKLESKVENLEEQLTQLSRQKDELEKTLEDKSAEVLKHMAELENFKRRKNQEVDTFKKFAAENVVKEFLPVIDNFVIACQHANENDQSETEIVKGFVLIEKQLQTTLEKLNVKMIESLNQPFNPDLHQAIGQEKSEEVDSGVVVKEVQKGFKLHDRVIRPAMVIVSE